MCLKIGKKWKCSVNHKKEKILDYVKNAHCQGFRRNLKSIHCCVSNCNWNKSGESIINRSIAQRDTSLLLRFFLSRVVTTRNYTTNKIQLLCFSLKIGGSLEDYEKELTKKKVPLTAVVITLIVILFKELRVYSL